MAARGVDTRRPRRRTQASDLVLAQAHLRCLSIAASVQLFELARFMGTSVEQIDRTYGHLLPDSIDRTRSALNAFVYNTALEGGGKSTMS